MATYIYKIYRDDEGKPFSVEIVGKTKKDYDIQMNIMKNMANEAYMQHGRAYNTYETTNARSDHDAKTIAEWEQGIRIQIA